MVSSSARKYRPARNASAKLMPSAEMPKPENIRRIVTGPKSANRSIRKSRSMKSRSRLSESSRRLDLRCGQLHGFAAAAGAGLVRVIEDELSRHLVDLVVHF